MRCVAQVPGATSPSYDRRALRRRGYEMSTRALLLPWHSYRSYSHRALSLLFRSGPRSRSRSLLISRSWDRHKDYGYHSAGSSSRGRDWKARLSVGAGAGATTGPLVVVVVTLGVSAVVGGDLGFVGYAQI
jgi:ABC-type dipeptide/oligopeptide/nickel transport system permease subunit